MQRKGRVLDWMADRFSVLRSHMTPEDRTLIDQLNETNSELANLALNGLAETARTEHEQQVRRSRRTEREARK